MGPLISYMDTYGTVPPCWDLNRILPGSICLTAPCKAIGLGDISPYIALTQALYMVGTSNLGPWNFHWDGEIISRCLGLSKPSYQNTIAYPSSQFGIEPAFFFQGEVMSFLAPEICWLVLRHWGILALSRGRLWLGNVAMRNLQHRGDFSEGWTMPTPADAYNMSWPWYVSQQRSGYWPSNRWWCGWLINFGVTLIAGSSTDCEIRYQPTNSFGDCQGWHPAHSLIFRFSRTSIRTIIHRSCFHWVYQNAL